MNEVSTNTLHYSPRVGTLRIWREPETLVCEVHDSGQITDLLDALRVTCKPWR